MKIEILTIFPGMLEGPFGESMIRRAVERGLVEIEIIDLRSFASGRHRQVDDAPYGGGRGMVFKPEPLFKAVETLQERSGGSRARVILLTPQGRTFNQEIARELSGEKRLLLICGRYEGVDERVREVLVDDEISIGDYILTGGELAAAVVVDAVVRLLPGFLEEASVAEESFSGFLLEYPHYTRPPVFRGMAVPPVLLSGDHAAIARWRRKQALLRTRQRRPDLLEKAALSPEDRRLLKEMKL
ncbi:MAG TPA: tRNA (guanosine(37)-N1)-methyltransferase TrmD [Bacillota bacterium]|jgi:tRNA (guanine37-N1)-methyltransferase|nr:tRNA (guanosine(37)-N1)-methyltransferase TrmD [Bacillota bacterium]HOA35689.1 tRNA (guanosine(37)-N1)-methyltransferase TrmD [Bacillota bacterium]HOJ83643.1 tRNA (guanosine(37)-N1)-methyltransferase TrmD [Bacillota bacterium]HOL15775.1 tRNA (guanosine(37)-N1)-methyltransferase TrmD [Bacillota bacterium]HPZ11610.1 tRNA (guanosine(37)-N1)-methyltransferase TrmD [Bacillota bacterium]